LIDIKNESYDIAMWYCRIGHVDG